MEKDLNNAEETILAIDIGTTNLKCFLFDKDLNIISSDYQKLNILHPYEGCSEIEPIYLFELIKQSILKLLNNNKEKFKIKSFGISTQRNSFILWNRKTGKLYTNFILWNDKRKSNTCKQLNKNILLNVVKNSAYIATKFKTNHRFETASNYKVDNTHVTARLIDQLSILETKLETNEFRHISCGTIEAWLVWALSKENNFYTDITCACSTGIYDIFVQDWSFFILKFFSISKKILPIVKNSCDDYGTLKNDFLNVDYDIPITSIIGDTQSSLVAECAFETGDCVITIGTGSFISVIVGDKPISSSHGVFPLAGFKSKNKQIYMLHCFVSTAGTIIDWAKSIGLFDSYDQIDDLLSTSNILNKVYFVPCTLEIPGINKNNLGSGFIGLNTTTTKCEMLKAIVDSLAFLIKIKFDLILKDLKDNNIRLRSIKLCGGVTNSKYFCQLLANLFNHEAEISNFSNSSSVYGVAFSAGLGSNMFTELKDLYKYRKIKSIFKPDREEITKNENYKYNLSEWRRALERFISWNEI